MRLQVLFLATLSALVFTVAACGDDVSTDDARESATEERDTAAEERRRERQERRERAERRRERAAAKRRQKQRRERREARAAAEQQAAEEQAAAEEPPAENCHPSYDPCLDPNASDYDCAGGSGDGPEYTGPVRVIGPDEYDLDADGDGSACES